MDNFMEKLFNLIDKSNTEKPIIKTNKLISKYDIIIELNVNDFNSQNEYDTEYRKLYMKQYRQSKKTERILNKSLEKPKPKLKQKPKLEKKEEHIKSGVKMLVDWDNPVSKSEYKKLYYKNTNYYNKHKQKINRDSQLKYYGKKEVVDFLRYVDSL